MTYKNHDPDCKCRLCYLSINDPRYRELWGMEVAKTSGVCAHLGAVTGDTVPCKSCRKTVQLKLFKCAIHGVCTPSRSVPGIPCCTMCSDYSDITKADPTEKAAPMKVRWCVGVTTVPERNGTLLLGTLRSLEMGGFPKPHLFVDGDLDYRRVHETYDINCYHVTVRNRRIRTYGNWILALWEMLVRNPDCDRFAIFQDDMICVRNLRPYLDTCQFPDGSDEAKTIYRAPGYWNLLSFPGNEARAAGRNGWYESNQRGWGAVGLVFNREGVITLLSSRHTVERPLDATWGYRKIDGGIVTAFMKAGWMEYVHAPSLIQHVGLVSSMGNDQHRPPETFPGEEYDAMQLRPVGVL